MTREEIAIEIAVRKPQWPLPVRIKAADWLFMAYRAGCTTKEQAIAFWKSNALFR